MNWFKNRKLGKKLNEIGTSISTSYVVKVNNEVEKTFDDKDSLLSYVMAFREQNVIFSLEMYRVEIYSL